MASGDRISRDPRRTQSDSDFVFARDSKLAPIRPPLITPRHSVDLPSISELELPAPRVTRRLLEKGRGVYPPPVLPVRTVRAHSHSLVFEGRKLAEYIVKDVTKDKQVLHRTFVMQQPTANENHAEFTREVGGGRSLTYVLDVAQPPKQARACGNGPRSSADRRPVDPPPVIKLSILQDGKVDVTGFYEANFVLFASLEFARPIANNSIYTTNHCPVLTGTIAAGAAYLSKPTNAAYFIFPDLSVRHEGYYRLKFHLFEQSKSTRAYNPVPVEAPSNEIIATNPVEQENMINQTFVYSPPFQVFSAKKFPGLEMSTLLSQTMSEQGCRVRIRRDVRQRRPDTKGGKKDEEQRSLRASSPDRHGSVDTLDHWGRNFYPADTRRPSIDSQYSQSIQTRTHSFAQSTLPSPTSIAPPYTGSHAAEVQSLWQPSYRNTNVPAPTPVASPSLASAPMGPPVPRYGYAPPSPVTVAPEASPRLPPSIADLLAPTEPQRPTSGLYETEPVHKKRALNSSSDERSAILKDRARPIMDARGSLSRFAEPKDRTPLAAAHQPIEADVNEDSDEDEEYDSDGLLDDLTSYRRASGHREYVSSARPSHFRR